MKKAIFILLLTTGICTLFYCKKEHYGSNELHCNSFYYWDFNPDTSINIIADSVIYYNLDVDNDSIPDIAFRLANGHVMLSHYPTSEDNINAWASDSLLFITPDPVWCRQGCNTPLDSPAYIHLDDQKSTVFLLLTTQTINQIQCSCFNLYKYMGFVLHKNGKDYLGWVRLIVSYGRLTIDDFATSLCVKDSIRVGEH